MKTFNWQRIKFADGSNPYVCITEKKFKQMQRKYSLVKIGENAWLAK